MSYRWDWILDKESGIAISIGKYPQIEQHGFIRCLGN